MSIADGCSLWQSRYASGPIVANKENCPFLRFADVSRFLSKVWCAGQTDSFNCFLGKDRGESLTIAVSYDAGHVSGIQIGILHFGTSQIGTCQVSFAKIGGENRDALQAGSGEICAYHI